MRAPREYGVKRGINVQAVDITSTGPKRRIRAQRGVEWEAAPATHLAWEEMLAASSDPHLTQTPHPDP
jgi:hypothetical protein